MGNSLSRYVLPPGTRAKDVIPLAEQLRGGHRLPSQLLVRDLRGRRVRKAELVAAQKADLVIVDVESRLPPTDLIAAGCAIFGNQGFLYRATDDEGLDVIHPDQNWLKRTFVSCDLTWVLEPEGNPIPWNTTSLYAFPGNVRHCDCTVPINFALLAVARPGERRPCPMCGHVYVTKFDQGQCPECGLATLYFRTQRDALAYSKTPIDTFAFGNCARCRRYHEFTSIIEQCLHCGQLLEADVVHGPNPLADNREQVGRMLRQRFLASTPRLKVLTEFLAKLIGNRR